MIKAETDIKSIGTFSNGIWSNVIIQVKYPMVLPNGIAKFYNKSNYIWRFYYCNNGYLKLHHVLNLELILYVV